MKVIVVRAHDKQIKGANPFIVGVFSSHEKADSEIEYLGKRYANAYHFSRTECDVDKREVGQSEPEVSLEERLEALEQYMNVAQMKIMALQNATQSMAFNLLMYLGEEKTKSIMQDVMKNFGRHR
jgi:hypothetical protein